MTPKLTLLPSPARSPESGARRLATACIRRARSAVSETQAGLAELIGASERSVRRAESGRHDLGILEVALRYPPFARALALELLKLPAVAGGGSKDRDPSTWGDARHLPAISSLRGGPIEAISQRDNSSPLADRVSSADSLASTGLYPVMDARGADPRASTWTSGFPGDSQPRKRAGNPGANDERRLKLVEQARTVVTAGETATFTALTESSRSPVTRCKLLADQLDDSAANSCGAESLPPSGRRAA